MIIKPLTSEEADALWKEAEGALTGAGLEILGRCYPEQSAEGIRYIMMSMRRTLVGIDNILLVLAAKKAPTEK